MLYARNTSFSIVKLLQLNALFIFTIMERKSSKLAECGEASKPNDVIIETFTPTLYILCAVDNHIKYKEGYMDYPLFRRN